MRVNLELKKVTSNDKNYAMLSVIDKCSTLALNFLSDFNDYTLKIVKFS